MIRDSQRHLAALAERTQRQREDRIREDERDRLKRRLQALLSQPEPTEDPEFPGCVW